MRENIVRMTVFLGQQIHPGGTVPEGEHPAGKSPRPGTLLGRETSRQTGILRGHVPGERLRRRGARRLDGNAPEARSRRETSAAGTTSPGS